MSDFIDGGGYSSQTTEVYLKRVLAGSIKNVRARLEAALERLGYDVIEEEPALRGRRGAKGWGAWYGSADILDYPMTLVIRLKPIGAHSTRATFDYVIKHPWLSKGEKEVLTREAEAITALATVRAADKLCAACGTEAMDDSRFCRRCGAPMTSEQAELDVLRMAAETRAGHTSVVTSAMLSLAAIAIAIFAWIAVAVKGDLTPKLFWTVIGFVSIINLFNFLVGWCAWGRLNSALKPKREEPRVITAGDMQTLSGNEAAALLPGRVGMSVTDGTTEFLNPQPREPETVRIKRGSNDKASIN
jgi:hypothetical protein